MSEILTICPQDLLNQVKLSLQMPSIVEGILTRKAIAIAAKNAGIRAEDEELQKIADALRLANNLHKAEDTFIWLKQQGLSLEDFEETIENTVIATKLAQHLFNDRLEAYFLERYLDYARVAIYEIILDDEDLALELFYALQEGEMNFQAIATEYISDKEMRRTGGYKGLLRRRDLNPKISSAVFAGLPPQILRPIVTSVGVHLILVEEIIKPELDDALKEQILNDLFSDWLKQEVKKFKVVLNLPEN